jgi:hypothetical protein
LSRAERAVQRIAHNRRHPRNGAQRGISAFGKRQAINQAIIEKVQLRRQLKEWLVDISKGRCGSMPDEWANPKFIGLPDS